MRSAEPDRRTRETGEIDGELSARTLTLVAVRVGTLLGVYVLIERWLMWISRLPPSRYEGSSIALELLHHAGWLPLLLVALVGTVVAFFRPLWLSWSELEHGRLVRGLIVLTAALMAWMYSTYDVNLYFDQRHALDRGLLVVLAALVWWRPFFVAPFVFLLLPVARQFQEPIGGYSLAQPLLPIRILILFVASFVLQVLSGNRKISDFACCFLVFVASAYVASGMAKVWSGWVTHGQIYCLLFATHANGWLPFVEPPAVTVVAKAVSLLDWPMRLATLLVECAAVLFLWRRRVLLLFLGGWIAFHLAVFALSGIFFWTWIILDSVLMAFFLVDRGTRSQQVFNPARFVLSVVLIGSSPLWLRPPRLSWFDVPVSYTYRFEATGEDGAERTLPPCFFAPYDYQFTLGDFGYLVDAPQPHIVWGTVSSRDLATSLAAATSTEDVWEIETGKGRNRYDERRAAELERFIRRFVSTFNARGKTVWWRKLQPPRQLWTFPNEIPFADGEAIAKVTIVQITSFFDGERYSEIRRTVVRAIEIPRRPASLRG